MLSHVCYLVLCVVGNRVTCRDWFQLTLKEGLTVFRDSEFSSDMNSRAVKRIEDVMVLRTSQFSEDAGPMAHPIRPDAYIKMDNFYTVTVYEKVGDHEQAAAAVNSSSSGMWQPDAGVCFQCCGGCRVSCLV